MNERVCVERNCIGWVDIGRIEDIKHDDEHTFLGTCPHCDEPDYYLVRRKNGPQVITCPSCFKDFAVCGELVFQYDKYLTLDDYVDDSNRERPF